MEILTSYNLLLLILDFFKVKPSSLCIWFQLCFYIKPTPLQTKRNCNLMCLISFIMVASQVWILYYRSSWGTILQWKVTSETSNGHVKLHFDISVSWFLESLPACAVPYLILTASVSLENCISLDNGNHKCYISLCVQQKKKIEIHILHVMVITQSM